MIVDEAGMADTPTLAVVVGFAMAAGGVGAADR